MSAVGVVKTIVVCQDSAVSAAPCPAGQAPAAVQAYVLESSSSSYFDAVFQSFDYASAAGFWTFAFVFTLSLYVSTRIFGSIVNMTR